ncbi:MAG: Y-family DNA polymerase [Phycisphaeraceae bacterium]
MLDWLFLDMDNYFASVEQQARPELRGRPVGVLPVMSEGSCCIAASVHAKRRGVKTGTRVYDARRLCPDIRFVAARPAYYVQVHKQIKAAVETVVPIDKVWSIDEMAVKLLGKEREPSEAMRIGKRVKRAVAEAVGECLTCSVGLAPTRLLAKVACELGKPDGLRALSLEDLPGEIATLELTDLPGINVGIRARLHRKGVCTIRDLWELSAQQAREAWGSVEGTRYWMALHGQEPALLPEHRRMFTHANVLAPELRTEHGAHSVMTRLLHKAAARLRCHGYVAHTLWAGISYDDDRRWGDQIDLPACQDTVTVVEHFERLWKRKRSYARSAGGTPAPPRPVKVSIGVGRLEPAHCATGRLFDNVDHRRGLGEVIDSINRKFGNHSLYLGGMHDIAGLEMQDKIAFGRVPDEAATM